MKRKTSKRVSVKKTSFVGLGRYQAVSKTKKGVNAAIRKANKAKSMHIFAPTRVKQIKG